MEKKIVKKKLFFTIGTSTIPAPAVQLRHFCTTKGTQICCHWGLVVLFGAVESSKVVGGVGGGADKLGWVYFDHLPPPCVYSPLAVQGRRKGWFSTPRNTAPDLPTLAAT